MTSTLTTAEIRQDIMDAPLTEWEFFDAPQTWVLTTNRDISLRLLYPHSREDREISQPDWASNLPNPRSEENRMRVEYRGAPIDQFPVHRLDEFRIAMITPDIDHDSDSDERVLTEYEAQLSRIISRDEFDAKVAGMDVRITSD